MSWIPSQGDLQRADRSHWMFRDCVLWLPMQAGAGGTAYDISGRQNHGTLTNMDPSTDWVVGERGGRALDFDGSDDRVDVAAADVFENLAQGPMTLSLRVRLDSYRGGGPTSYIFNTWDSGGGFNLFCRTAGDERISFAVYTTGSAGIWDFSTVDTNWHHLALTYDGSSPTTAPTLWIDGVPESPGSTQNPTGSLVTDAGHTLSFMGRDLDNNRNQDGRLADVRAFRRVLRASEIDTLYADPWQPFARRKTFGFLSEAAPPTFKPWLAARRTASIIGGGI